MAVQHLKIIKTMNNINKPNKRTFWKVNTGSEEHTGITETNQVTSTKYSIENSDNADTIFPPLPASGTVTEGEIYSYQGGMVEVRQTHERTGHAPNEVPALFSVFRANTEGAEWVANEEVIRGDTRTYNGKTYRCVQSHTTQENWQPDSTPALWAEIVEQTDQWSAGVSYSIGDTAKYNGTNYECIQAHTSQVGWEPSNVPALWSVLN